ncbi:LLM class flavin-dependent oxidoreductase [Parvularcula dongshanensis]|uniref:Luciferase-like monooxygenase n=1 Tax=Parvularcula dongshanensis TaxID=1173995 RepID=A0A840I3Z9_9PROT|nr:LLM class flavin-dependent oxidoreductase [Parvularcula dongshanensis]MBB4659052.1 luciferase family oxidoreductase group 1 [Parvularcula dongshanensis]
MIPLSILDLAPIVEGSDAQSALRASGRLAKHAEGEGYTRYWMAEHHSMTGVASAATAVALSYVGSQTNRIRIGAGGVMLPNHAPLTIAEQFGTLATLYPGRVDLGLGRAPGGDLATAKALRRNSTANESFPQDVQELLGYLADGRSSAVVRAIPGEGTKVPVWILGSSLYGAQLAAALGLPYAFASHFAPAALSQALDVYRRSFRPSSHASRPYFMLAANVFAADTHDEALFLRSSAEQAFANLMSGRPGPLPRPDADFADRIDPGILASVRKALSVSATGTVEDVRADLSRLAEAYAPDEIILTGNIHDEAARRHSFSLAMEAMRGVKAAAA